MDMGALPGRGQFPIAVDVTVPVEPAAKAGLLVGRDEPGEVGFAESGRQRPSRAGRQE